MHPPDHSSINPNPNFPNHHQEEHLNCPRCASTNTKFCYYNNYNLSQPRYYCKDCRRYWTKGGTLRNIPIGGGTRKITKRNSTVTKHTSPTTLMTKPPVPVTEKSESGSSGSGYSVGPLGSLLMEGANNKSGDSNGDDFGSGLLRLNHQLNGNGNGVGWVDLSIFTPASRFC